MPGQCLQARPLAFKGPDLVTAPLDALRFLTLTNQTSFYDKLCSPRMTSSVDEHDKSVLNYFLLKNCHAMYKKFAMYVKNSTRDDQKMPWKMYVEICHGILIKLAMFLMTNLPHM